MSERRYFVICEDNCRFESLTREQIFAAIAEATGSTPTPVDEAFITKIKEQNANHSLKMWKGTEAQFNALEEKDADTIYFIGTNKIGDFGGQIERIATDPENHNHDERYFTEQEINAKLQLEDFSVRVDGASETDEITYDRCKFSSNFKYGILDVRAKYTGVAFIARTPMKVGVVDELPSIGHTQALCAIDMASRRKAVWNAYISWETGGAQALYIIPNMDITLGDTESLSIQINGIVRLT